MRRLCAVLALSLLLLLVACRQEEAGGEPLTPPPQPAQPTPTATAPAGAPSATPTSPSILPPQRAITLTVWTNQEISGLGDSPGDIALQAQVAAFDQDRSAITIQVRAKSLTGQGSILNYLRAGRAVAPGILPDLILIPGSQLATAASEQLIYPVDGLIEAPALADLYPASAQLVRVDDRLMGYPFALRGLNHFTYQPNVITDTLPATWSALMEQSAGSLLLPAAGPDIGRFLLAYYLAEGGTTVSEANRPALEIPALTAALSLLQAGRQSGLILLRSSNVATLADAWQIFENGEAGMTLVTASQFLNERSQGATAGYGPMPGPTGPIAPVVESWVWAISTPDPARQQAAADLIGWLVATENLGQWSLANLSPPGRRSAFELWPQNDPYIDFLQAELDRARALPATASATFMQALADAAIDVISLQSTPAEAARAAAQAIQP